MHLPQGGGPAALRAVIGAVPAARRAEPGPSPPSPGHRGRHRAPTAVRSAEPSAPGSGQGSAAGGGSRALPTAQARRQAGLGSGINAHAPTAGEACRVQGACAQRKAGRPWRRLWDGRVVRMCR